MKKRFLCLLLLLALLAGCSFTPATEPTPVSGDTLQVHFIDVGQADCALISCGGKYMLIDGGNVEDSSLVVSYLQKLGITELEAVVCSHAHEDHVGGLPGVLAVFRTHSVYAPTRTYSSNCFDDFMYYVNQQDLTVTIPSPGDTFSLGSAVVTVLGPTKSYADTNNTSLVLRVQFGATRFLFTGDMETDAERDLVDSGADLKADVLKVGHHGSDTSTGYLFLRSVAPKYGVISVGKGNSYGHPCEEPLSRLEDADVEIYRTDKLGHIIATSDGKTITFTWGNTSAQPDSGSAQQTRYIGNINSKTLHLPSCSSLPAEKNQIVFTDYDQAIAAGYTPCSRCME